MNKKVLLIADDDEMNRRIIKRFFKDSYDVIEAENGRVAYDTLSARDVDALLLDIIMPEMDGLELLEKLRADEKFNRLAILVATSAKEETERPALSLGADDVVSKPYDPLVIKRRLSNMLDAKELAAQKNLLEAAGSGATVPQCMRDAANGADALAATLKQYTAVINANHDNFRLVAEITANINIEAEKFAENLRKQL